ncbi:MAG: alpha-1,2-fucosyltransferase [Gemmatimonadales bacterium]
MLQPGDWLFTTGMGELLTGFTWDRQHVVNRGVANGALTTTRRIRRIAARALRYGIPSSIQQPDAEYHVDGESYHMPGPIILRTRGRVPRLLYIGVGYYQDPRCAAGASFRLKPAHLDAGRAFLAALPPGPRAFVHVRRGDYRNWTPFGRSPLLGFDYFRQGIARIERAAPGTQFVLVSDDLAEVTPALAHPGLHVFAGGSVYQDFGVMTLCDGGVMSNSTLSWWGGFFCRRTLPVVSPIGFVASGLDFEYPEGITADWMTPIHASG